jgi:isocitrate/isopropylmalate dehydrogenase
MLHHLKLHDAGAGIGRAVEQVLTAGYRTHDICRTGSLLVGCEEMGKLVRQTLKSSL